MLRGKEGFRGKTAHPPLPSSAPSPVPTPFHLQPLFPHSWRTQGFCKLKRGGAFSPPGDRQVAGVGPVQL